MGTQSPPQLFGRRSCGGGGLSVLLTGRAAAWAWRAPGRARLPPPRRVAYAVAGILLRDGRWRLAICILVMFVSYLRPGEAAKLHGRHLISPSEAAGAGYQFFGLLLHESGQDPGKTGVNDESILFDRETWLTPLLHALKQSTAPSAPLWGPGRSGER